MNMALFTRPLVIMVDDSETDLMLNKMAFATSGAEAEVLCFESGLDALDYLRSSLSEYREPALMILDVKMPEISGFEMLEMMRNAGMKRFPVVILSGSSMPEDTFRARQLGADACYEKPITIAESNRLFTMIARRHLAAVEIDRKKAS